MPRMVFDPAGFGVLTRRELIERGVDGYQRSRAVARGELIRVHPGVFVVQPPPCDARDRWRQACAVELARAGPDGLIAQGSAAALWDLDGWEPPTPISIAVPRRSGRRSPNLHRTLPIGEPDERHGLPVTGIERTLVELGTDLRRRQLRFGERPGPWLSPADQVELAVECALRRLLVSEADLLALTATLPRQRRGVALLDEVLRSRPPGQPPTESYLETRCIQVLRDAGLPTGDRQVPIFDDLGRSVGRVDLRLAPSVLVEVDGREFHGEDRYEADRRRWTRLSSLGFGLAVFTWQNIDFEPGFVAGRVRDLLARY